MQPRSTYAPYQSILLMLASLFITGCNSNGVRSIQTSTAGPDPSAVFSAINERLSYMEDVALFKANHQRPIEDIKREAFVIEKAAKSAQEFGLNRESIVAFFTSQISAAKAIQYRYRADLLSQPSSKKPRDLT